jgi:hypothetical protein
MKEYIFLFRGGKTDSASDQELDEHERAWDDWMDSLEEEGVLIDGLPMKDHAVIVDKNGASARQGSADDSVTGYLILETTDMEMAIELAQDCPIFDFGGTIEVRELESHLDELSDDDDDDGFRDIGG